MKPNWQFYTHYEFAVQKAACDPESKVIEFTGPTGRVRYISEETHFYDWCQGVINAFNLLGYSVINVWRKADNNDFLLLDPSEYAYPDKVTN